MNLALDPLKVNIIPWVRYPAVLFSVEGVHQAMYLDLK